jgi:ribosomal protein L40E
VEKEEYMKPNEDTDRAVFCGRCGAKLDNSSQVCKNCGMDNTEPKGEVTNTGKELSLSSRYGNAYFVANSIISTGKMIKELGILLAILIGMASVIGWVKTQTTVIVILGVAAAFSLGLFLIAIGTIFVAQGQTLLALLDSAVNTSPLIDNQQKAKIIGVEEV